MMNLRVKGGAGFALLGLVSAVMGCQSENPCIERLGPGTARHLEMVEPPQSDFWFVVEDGVDVVWTPVEDSLGDEHAVWWGMDGLVDGGTLAWVGDSLVIWDANACRWLKRPDEMLVCSLFTRPPLGMVLTGHGDVHGTDTLRRDTHFSLIGSRSISEVNLNVQVDSLFVSVPTGAMTIRLGGKVRRAGAYISGLSSLDAAELATAQFQIHAATNRLQQLRASSYAYVALAGTGDVWLHGDSAAVDVLDLGLGGNLVIWPD